MQEAEREVAVACRATRAVWEALCGNPAEARTAAFAALELSKDLEKRFPEDTFVKFTYVPVLRALASQAKGQFAGSVVRLEITRSYELAVNGLNFPYLILGGLHSAYVRGLALATRRTAEAEAEFRKILDHRGLTGLDPIGALAHLQLGRLAVLSGDKRKAKAAYEAFPAVWKQADPDVSERRYLREPAHGETPERLFERRWALSVLGHRQKWQLFWHTLRTPLPYPSMQRSRS